MASITSLTSSSSSSSSSIYGNSNIISGLASGMDTESMIENSVSGYKTKITELKKDQTKITWKQDAYRSIISKMNSMTKKYTSYTSTTNLYSKSFFNNAVTISTTGANASKASATGKTSSEVKLNGVKQLATAAKYTVGLNNTKLQTNATESSGKITVSSEAIDFSKTIQQSNVSGTITLQYGGSSDKQFDISLDSDTIYTSAEELKEAIESKLSEIDYDSDEKLSDRVKVEISEDGTISFSDNTSAGNSVSIQSVSGKIAGSDNGIDISKGDDVSSFRVTDASKMSSETTTLEALSGKTLKVTYNGKTKSISIPEMTGDTNDEKLSSFTSQVQSALDKAFGTGKVQLSTEDSQIQFTVDKGSTLSVTSDSNSALGLGSNGITTYLDTSKKLSSLLGDYEGEQDLVINGVTIGSYSSDTSLETIMNAINNSEAGVKVSYSKTTNEFLFAATDTGEASQVEFGGELAKTLFGTDDDGNIQMNGTYTAGQDAEFSVTVNGTTMDLQRSSNTADIDGLKITFKEAFGYEGDTLVEGTESIGFETSSDTDKIVDAIKSFVEEYNALVEEIHDQYSTAPAIKSDGDKYEPLSEEDEEDMSDTAIENWNEKAKQGILFGDSLLSGLYSSLRSIITVSGSDGTAMKSIGLTTAYSSGLTTISLDEETLRDAVENNLETVRDVFAKSKSDGASTDGLMTKMKNVLDEYASTSTGSPGLLVSKAGTSLSSTSLLSNTLQKQLDSLDDQIDSWEDKMNDKIDYYTEKYSNLEQLISEMNNQSSMLSGLTG